MQERTTNETTAKLNWRRGGGGLIEAAAPSFPDTLIKPFNTALNLFYYLYNLFFFHAALQTHNFP